MSEQTWDELALVTARIEKLCGDRTVARYLGNAHLKDHANAQIKILLERRNRLIDRLSDSHAAPRGLGAHAAPRASTALPPHL